jgi:hypothetical protein
LQGGSCAAGAAGGAAGALFSGYISTQDNLTPEQRNALADEATLVSGLAGSLLSQGDITNATLAGSVGGSAFR